MKFRSTAALLAALASLATTAQAAEPLRIGADLTYPPYDYRDAAGAPAGFDVELMTLVAETLGRSPEFVETRFANLILGVSGGQFDVVASALYVTKARAQQIDYVPYMKTGVSIAVTTASGNGFARPEDLCGKRVGSIAGAAWLADLAELNKTTCKDAPIDSREFPTSPEATQALMSGGVDAQMDNSAVLAAAAEKTRGRVKISSTEQLYPVIVGLAVKKGNTALADALREALAKLAADPRATALYARYNLEPATQAEFAAAIAE